MPCWISAFEMTPCLVTNAWLNCSQERENTSTGYKDPDILQNIPRKLWNLEVAVWCFGEPSKKMAQESSWIPLLTKKYWRKDYCQCTTHEIYFNRTELHAINQDWWPLLWTRQRYVWSAGLGFLGGRKWSNRWVERWDFNLKKVGLN